MIEYEQNVLLKRNQYARRLLSARGCLCSCAGSGTAERSVLKRLDQLYRAVRADLGEELSLYAGA